MSVRTLVKSIQNIMRQDTGVDDDAQRISQLRWMFFLKIIDDQELELMQAGYRSSIPERFWWCAWAADPAGITCERMDRRCDASDGACKLRMMRGGSWLSRPRASRSADRVMTRSATRTSISAFAPPETRGRCCESTNHRNRRHDSWKR